MKVTKSIRFKLMGGFIAVVAVFGLLIIVSVRIAAERNFKQHVNQSDISRAGILADVLESYYERYGNWENVEEALGILPMLQRFGPGMMRNLPPEREPHAGEIPGRGPRGMERGRALTPGIVPSIVLTDDTGTVLFDSAGLISSERIGDENLREAVPVMVDGSTVGYVLLGSMLDTGLDMMQQDFIRSLTRWLIILTIIIAAIAVLTGSLIFQQIIIPLKEIGRATEELSRGDLSARAQLSREDEIGQLGDRFNAMADSLEASKAWRKQIIDDSAHELRTPVSLLQGRLEMMIEGVYPIDRKQIEALSEEAGQLQQLVEELKLLSEAEGRMTVLRKEEVDLDSLCRSIADKYEADVEKKKIEIELALQLQSSISIDRKKITQVLSNLLQNALRHTPESGIIRISSGAESSGQSVFIAVEDSGPGIPESERAKVFERFYRIDHARNRQEGGRGLGLAIASAIVGAHGGDIRLTETELGGACFVLSLPI